MTTNFLVLITNGNNNNIDNDNKINNSNYNITCARIISLASGLSFSARGQGLYTATITMTFSYFPRKIKKISTVETKTSSIADRFACHSFHLPDNLNY